MKIFTGIAVLAIAAVSVSAQSAKSSKPLSAAFAKAALLALKAIEGDTYGPSVDSQGQITVGRATQERIDAADVEAVTSVEKTMAAGLQSVYMGKILNNGNRELIRMRYETESHSTNEVIQRLYANSAMAKDTEIAAMSKAESACFTALDGALRARSTKFPESCHTMAETH